MYVVGFQCIGYFCPSLSLLPVFLPWPAPASLREWSCSSDIHYLSLCVQEGSGCVLRDWWELGKDHAWKGPITLTHLPANCWSLIEPCDCLKCVCVCVDSYVCVWVVACISGTLLPRLDQISGKCHLISEKPKSGFPNWRCRPLDFIWPPKFLFDLLDIKEL